MVVADPIQRVAANMVGSSATLATSITTSWGQAVPPEHFLVCGVITDLGLDPAFVAPGWTQIGTTINTLTYAMAWWWRTSGVSEAAAVTVSWTGLAGQCVQVLGEYTGLKVVTPHETAVLATQSGLITSAPSITAAAANTSPALFLGLIGMLAPVARSALLGDFNERVYQSSATVSLSLLDTVIGKQAATCGCTLGAAIAWAAAIAAFNQTPDQSSMPMRFY